MSTIAPEALRQVLSVDDLIELLHDDLDWPIDVSDLSEATFDYEPVELGIDADALPKDVSLRQLRPMATGQPWGVFFVELPGNARLPIVTMRRLLRALVRKKRAGRGPERRTWDQDDLLFLVVTGAGASVEFHVVAFFDSGEQEPRVQSLSWRPATSPPQHLRRVSSELIPQLAWPDDTADARHWRETWRSALKLRPGEAIKSAGGLAERMATVARSLREQIGGALLAEGGDGPFSDLLAQIRRDLVAGVDADRFADMCAQTIVYGTLLSRVSEPKEFGAEPVLTALPLDNPFLAALLAHVYEHAAALDLSDSGLEALVADLRDTKVEAIIDQFGAAHGADPVIHFYEAFLARYDSKMRADAGAFYTPQPVVAAMVAGVDELLRTRFALPAGIADGASWAEVAAAAGFEVPAGQDPSAAFVSMVDPATGTGTFLVEWLRQARRSFDRAHRNGDWPAHLAAVVAPSMHAFELMLAPYAIAHLKVALALTDVGAPDEQLGVLLTDTVDHPASQHAFATMTDLVAIEGERAATLKEANAFTVCIGNPPYDREQRDAGAGAKGRRKGGVVRHGVAGISPLFDAIAQPMKGAGLGGHLKNAYNDYVYFWRWATWQVVERRRSPGVVAFIDASSFLDGVSLGGLRAHLCDTFDELWVVDLGGEGRGALAEENVFAIRTPVAIAFGVNRTGGRPARCQVRYRRIPGTRDEKLDAVGAWRFDDDGWTDIDGDGLASLTPANDSAYRSWAQITDLFPWIHSGAQFKRTWPIAAAKAVLEQRWDELVNSPLSERSELLKSTRDRTIDSVPFPLLTQGQRLKAIAGLDRASEPEGTERYGYRSFDRQWAIADHRLADFPRPDLWQVRGRQQVFLTTLTSTKLGAGPALTASAYVPDLHHFRGSYGAKDVMPLWLDSRARRANVTAGLLDVLSAELGRTIGAKDLAAYVYGLTATGAFTARFSAELAEAAGPVHVPLTSDRALFERVVALGRDLLWWHTWGERFGPEGGAQLPDGSAKVLEPVRGVPESYRWSPEARGAGGR